ncbi:MAG: pyrimidine operon attenuation protein/uracil phosphoribosyltransferase [Saprospiraceae bacterium]|jgi:pyrimidine operon attenuation protein/uracil phosphoribosyltransferase
MKLLINTQIAQKINRLAIEILEHNYTEKSIVLAGINNNGLGFAKLIKKAINKISDVEITLANITLNPAKPTKDDVNIDLSDAQLKNEVVIIVDDVANTGRTIFYAFKPFLDILTKKVEVAVLVDRKHKSFPIKVDYVGLSLATTLQDNIKVKLGAAKEREVCLE